VNPPDLTRDAMVSVGLTSPEAIKNLIGMVRAEATTWRFNPTIERDPVEQAGFLDVIANTLSALSEPAAPAGAEVVKALEWRERGDGTEFAVTDFGLLYVASDLGWGTRNYPDKNPVTGGISAAKAAAQADYEARIRSALTHPAPADKGVEQ
jgi:hypothetical protein